MLNAKKYIFFFIKTKKYIYNKTKSTFHKKIIIIQLPVHKKIQLPHLIHNNYIK